MPSKLPPLNALKNFESAARLMNFSKAADELCVTPGAVSQQIRVLEEYFDQQLFVRAGGKVFLNPAGERLLRGVEKALAQIQEVSAELLGEEEENILTIHSTVAFAGRWLIPRLSDFQNRYPDITIKLLPSNRLSSSHELEPDVVVRWSASIANTNKEKLFDVDSFIACAPQLLTGVHPLNTPSALKHHTLIHDDDGRGWRQLSEVFSVNLAHCKATYFFDSLLAIQVAIEGGGVIVAGSVLAAQDIAEGKLVIPFQDMTHCSNAYYISYSRFAKEKKKVLLFKDWIHGQALSYIQDQSNTESYIAAC